MTVRKKLFTELSTLSTGFSTGFSGKPLKLEGPSPVVPKKLHSLIKSCGVPKVYITHLVEEQSGGEHPGILTAVLL